MAPFLSVPNNVSSIRTVDPTVLDRIVELVSQGTSITGAAKEAGLRSRRVKAWVERGSDDSEVARDPAMVDFAMRVREAEGQVEHRAVSIIDKAAQDGDWKAAAWLLERKFPDIYRQRSTTEHTGEDGLPIKVTVADLMKQGAQARQAPALKLIEGGGDPLEEAV